MVGLSKDMATKIVESGLPMMANVADGDPWVFKAMFAQSVKYLPQPTPAFYAKLGKNAAARQALAADFAGHLWPDDGNHQSRYRAPHQRHRDADQPGALRDHAGGGQGVG